MALVHSRIRRVIYAIPNKEDGGLGGTGNATSVHMLPGTNHHYRAFRYLGNGDCSSGNDSVVRNNNHD